MEEREQKLTERASLELIGSMICNARAQLARNSGRPFLIWGYTTVAVSLWEYAMHRFDLYWGWGWLALPVIGYLLMYLLVLRHEGSRHVKSYIDKAITALWTVFGVSMLFAFGAAVVWQVSIFFMVTLLIGMGTAITGAIVESRAVIVGGALSMLSSTVFAVRYLLRPTVEQVGAEGVADYMSQDMLIFAAIFFLLMCIPGHMLNRRGRRAKREEVERCSAN